MTRLIVCLILMVPSIALAQLRAPFLLRADPGGGTGTGVEARYTTLGLDSHVVARCSEPVDGGGSLTNASPDSSLSPDASECWGRGGNWQNATYQGSGQTIASVTGWGDVTQAAQQSPGGDWWLAYKPTAIASDFGLGAGTICVRYYKQVASDYSTASFNCGGGTTRNKLTEIENVRPGSGGSLYDAFQMQEDQHDGCGDVSVGRGIMACYGSGPADEPGCVWLSPTVKLLDAVSHPIRIEQCIESTDISTGANMVVKSYVTKYPYTSGDTSSHTTPAGLTLGPLHGDSTSFGDLDHTGSGTGWHGYFIFSIWNDVNNHTIGAACEIEGGC